MYRLKSGVKSKLKPLLARVKTKAMTQNPFYVGGPVPPEYFFGRASELKTAFDQITKRAHLALYGSSGAGKSSFLRYLAHPEVWQARGQDSSKAFIVSLNCLSITPFTAKSFWREVLTLLREEAENDEALQLELEGLLQEEEIEKGDLRRILREVGKRNKFLLLLLDDYDVVLRPNELYTETEMLTFLGEFRNLAVHSKEGQYLSTVVTTFRRLTESGPNLKPGGSPWYNHYLFRLLRPLTSSDVNAQLCIPMPTQLREGVLGVIGGNPALLQNAGYLLYDAVQVNQAPNSETFIQDFISATRQYFENTWDFSSEEEQLLLMLIALCRLEGRLNNKKYALNDIEPIFSQRSRELVDLEERGVIHRTVEADKSIYSFSSSMMEWWVLREIENSNENDLEKREKVWLKLMSREQAGQVTKIFQEVWKNRGVVHSVITWVITQLG